MFASYPRRARELSKSALEGLASPALVDVVVLLISELVTNAVIHARSPVELVVTFAPGVVRVEVSDHGLGSMPAAMSAQPFDEGGRGPRHGRGSGQHVGMAARVRR